MECPKCIGKLEKIVVGQLEETPFHVDQCFLCRGLWFDKGELERALSLRFALTKTAREDQAPCGAADGHGGKKAGCPRCGTSMEERGSFRDYRIRVDHCATCGGTWTDGGEFELLMRGGYFARFFRRLRRSLPIRFDGFSITIGGRRGYRL